MATGDYSGGPPQAQFVCESCSKSFSAQASRGARRYCSYGCCADYRKQTGKYPRSVERVIKKCQVCGSEIQCLPSQAKRRFCSQACMIKWRGAVLSSAFSRPETKTIVECRWCGALFKTYYCKISAGRGRFCSRTCRAAYSANRCQNRISKAETRFVSALLDSGLRPSTQHRIGKWTVDVYFSSYGLAVEFDGEYWHSLPHVIEKDKRKSSYLEKRGIQLLRVPERLWLECPDEAIDLVQDALDVIRRRLRKSNYGAETNAGRIRVEDP